MNEPNFGEDFNHPGSIEKTGQDLNSSVVNPVSSVIEQPITGPLIDEPLVDEGLVQEAPMGQTIVYNQDSMGATVVQVTPNVSEVEPEATFLGSDEAEHYRTHWNEIQGRFVDEPRSAVQQADALVWEVTEKIAHIFADEYSSLEEQWKQGKDVSTEDLRKTLQRYRTFFNRLLMQIPD